MHGLIIALWKYFYYFKQTYLKVQGTFLKTLTKQNITGK